jgi:hypothetical protein
MNILPSPMNTISKICVSCNSSGFSISERIHMHDYE